MAIVSELGTTLSISSNFTLPFRPYQGAFKMNTTIITVQARIQKIETIPVTMMAAIVSLLTLGFSSISVMATSCYDFNIQYIPLVNKKILRMSS